MGNSNNYQGHGFAAEPTAKPTSVDNSSNNQHGGSAAEPTAKPILVGNSNNYQGHGFAAEPTAKPILVGKSGKTSLQEQIHAGRRAKLRTRFLTDGLGTFTESEVLEFALGFVLPRVDTNLAAHSLLNRFGSLTAVVDAKPADLQEAFGIGEQAAIFISFLRQCHRYLAKLSVSTVKLLSPGRAKRYLQPLMKAYSVEQFVVVCLDNADNVKSVNAVSNDELAKVTLNVREVISLVTSQKAAKVIIAHNHLNECPEPSVSDMNLTRRLVKLFQLLDVTFVDHLIFAGEQSYSFVDSGMLPAFKDDAAKHR